MQIYPAVDIENGRCVRLKRGVFSEMNIYSDSPAGTAKEWESQGATYLHLVDLDGARQGFRVNEDAIRSVVQAVNIPVEMGGGVRSLRDVEDALNMGVSRVIIGTQALETPELMREAVQAFGAEKIAAGIDAVNGCVAVRGWESVSEITAAQLACRMAQMGVQTVIYTDISRDGMLSGPNTEAAKALADLTGMEVVASGGVSSMDDLRILSEAGIRGVIIGKALYEGKISLPEAIAEFQD